MAKQDWLIVGLGNPGPKYFRNRHNVGALAIEMIAKQNSTSLTKNKANVWLGKTNFGSYGVGQGYYLAIPDTYMNTSGGPVGALTKYYSIPAERIIVIHDELDIPFGQVRVKRGGGEGGHNGLRDISRVLGTKDYVRLRLGIGRPSEHVTVADYVLSDFPKAKSAEVETMLLKASECVESIVKNGVSETQNKFHSANS